MAKEPKQVNMQQLEAIKVILDKDDFKESITTLLSPHSISFDVFMAGVRDTIVRNAGDISNCTPVSVKQAIINAASMGWRLDPALRHATLVCFAGKAQLMPLVRGLEFLAYRSLGVNLLYGAIHENDEYDYEQGSNPSIKVKPALSNRGKLLASYCIGVYPDGRKTQLIISGEREIANAKKKSPVKNIWNEFEDEMAISVPIRFLCRRLPAVDLKMAQAIAEVLGDFEEEAQQEQSQVQQQPNYQQEQPRHQSQSRLHQVVQAKAQPVVTEEPIDMPPEPPIDAYNDIAYDDAPAPAAAQPTKAKDEPVRQIQTQQEPVIDDLF